MTAYYNEIDPAAAQWLRNLIDAGHIAPGIVDERSIEDVYPSDLRGFTQCHFFAGIGVWSYALRQAGWSDDRPVWTGSCPCQPFSAAGKGAGFDDERHLWPAFHHLIKECAPAIVIGEQVASKDSDPWIDLVHTDLEALGYAFGAIPFPSAGVGAPHIRDRLYWVANAAGGGWRKEQQNSRGRNAGTGTGQAVLCSGGCNTGGLANPANEREHGISGDSECQSGKQLRAQQERLEHDGGGAAGGVEHAGQNDAASQVNAASVGESQAIGPANQLGRSGVSLCGLADTEREQYQECLPRPGQSDSPERSWQAIKPSGFCGIGGRPGPTNGIWRAADWLLCRDGKWRPVEPGTFPLAHGATARVVRLRAYGNAINAKAAQAFIESLT
jgi:DNA (cytosine-5)-methyltransferase 1